MITNHHHLNRSISRILAARLKNDISPRISIRNPKRITQEWMQAIQDYKYLSHVDKCTDKCTDKYLRTQIIAERLRLYCDRHVPLSYILGLHSFLGLNLKCRRPILIPRWETEEWVNQLIHLIGDKSLRIVDLGCGTGAIGLAIAKHCVNTTVTCVDINPKATALTKLNSLSNNCNIHVLNRSFENVEQQFDMVVCNPPYIQYGTPLPPSVRLWEDPCALYTRVIESFQQVLNSFHPHSTDPSLPRFVFEVGGRCQAKQVMAYAQTLKYTRFKTFKDSASITRTLYIY